MLRFAGVPGACPPREHGPAGPARALRLGARGRREPAPRAHRAGPSSIMVADLVYLTLFQGVIGECFRYFID